MDLIIQQTLDYHDMEAVNVSKIIANEQKDQYEFIQQALHKINMASGLFS